MTSNAEPVVGINWSAKRPAAAGRSSTLSNTHEPRTANTFGTYVLDPGVNTNTQSCDCEQDPKSLIKAAAGDKVTADGNETAYFGSQGDYNSGTVAPRATDSTCNDNSQALVPKNTYTKPATNPLNPRPASAPASKATTSPAQILRDPPVPRKPSRAPMTVDTSVAKSKSRPVGVLGESVAADEPGDQPPLIPYSPKMLTKMGRTLKTKKVICDALLDAIPTLNGMLGSFQELFRAILTPPKNSYDYYDLVPDDAQYDVKNGVRIYHSTGLKAGASTNVQPQPLPRSQSKCEENQQLYAHSVSRKNSVGYRSGPGYNGPVGNNGNNVKTSSTVQT